MKRPRGFSRPKTESEEPPSSTSVSDDVPRKRRSTGAFLPDEAPQEQTERATDSEPTASGTDSDNAHPDENVSSARQARRRRKRVERREIKRFTVRQRRARRSILIATGAVVCVALASVGVAYSPVMAVTTIDVEGADQIKSGRIVDDLQSQVGTPLPLVDQRAIKAKLVKYPLIQSYTVEARPPGTLVVRLIERDPVGVLKRDSRYALVDPAGVAVRTSEKRIDGYPIIDVKGGVDGTGFASAAAVLRALPDSVRDRVDTVTASTHDDVTLTFDKDEATVTWGSADSSAIKAEALLKLMKAYPPKEVKSYDVSSAKNVVVTPK